MSSTVTRLARDAGINQGQALAPAPWTAADLARYRREGFLTRTAPVLPPVDFAALQAHFADKLAALPPGARPEDMDVPHLTDTRLFAWLLAPDVLDLVEPILGPDLALFSSHFICKPPGDGRRVPWHQDSFYWKHMLDPVEVVTVWLALDGSDSGNGAMQVIPRTHLTDTTEADYDPVDLREGTFPRELKRHLLDPARAVTLELGENRASLHDARLFHGSGPNTSARRRCGFTMRYISARTRFKDAAAPYHHIYLARGRDHAGNAYGDITRTYPELAAARAARVRRGH